MSIRLFNAVNLEKIANRILQARPIGDHSYALRSYDQMIDDKPDFAFISIFASGTNKPYFRITLPYQSANHRKRKTSNLENINLILEVGISKDCNI